MAVSDSDSEVSSKAKVRNGKKKVVDSDSESEKQKVSEVDEDDEDDEEYEIEDILEAKRSTISPVRTFPCLTRSSGKEREIVVDIDSNTFLGLAYIPCEVERVRSRAQQLGGRKWCRVCHYTRRYILTGTEPRFLSFRGARDLINEFWAKEKEKNKSKGSTVKPRKSGARDTSEAVSASKKRKKAKEDLDDEDGAGVSKASKKRSNTSARRASAAAEDEEDSFGMMEKYMNQENWEKLVDTVDTVERGTDGELYVYFTLYALPFPCMHVLACTYPEIVQATWQGTS